MLDSALPEDPQTKRAVAPAFQFYPSDFLSSPKVIAMTATERGIYITLLCICWMEGGLPDDPARLANWCQVPLKQFARIWPHNLASCFVLARNGRLMNERLDRERLKQQSYRTKQAENGQKGGRPKAMGSFGLEPAKGLGSFGLSETKPKKSSSSSISNLQSSTSVVPTAKNAVGTARPQPIVQRRRKDAAFEWGRLYVPNRAHADMLMLGNHPDGEKGLFVWYEHVCESYTQHADWRIDADLIAFWKRMYAQQWPAETKAKSGTTKYAQWKPTGTDGRTR